MNKHLSAVLIGLAMTSAAFAEGPCNEQSASMKETPAVAQAPEELAIYTRWSDERLKTDITQIGAVSPGINVYTYEIFGKRDIGVMAQELEKIIPEAVTTDPVSGYKMVRYDLIPGWDKFIAERRGLGDEKVAGRRFFSDERMKSNIELVGTIVPPDAAKDELSGFRKP